MRKGWKRVKIGDLGKVVTGNTPPKKDSSNYGIDYPFIKPTDMDLDRRYVTSWDENYSEKAFKKYKNSYIPPKATGVVTIGTVGEKMFQADRWCFTNQSVNVVIANDDYDDDFIYYVLKINLPKVLGANPGTASGRHHVSKSNFCAIKIDVPKSKETQRKIASILSAYDDLIENNLKRINLLEEQAQQTYEEWFVRFKFPGYEEVAIDEESGLPVGWKVKDIDSVCTTTGGGTPSRKIDEYWNDGNISWFSPTDLSKTNGYCILDSSQKITELGLKKSSAKILQRDSFMMTSRATIGLFAMIEKPFSTNQGFINVTPFELYHKEYLFHNFMSRIDEFKGYGTGSTFPEISKGTFRALNIIWPDNTILIQFHKRTSIIHKNIFNLQNQNQHLKEARDILLPRLMSGMIDVDGLEIGEQLKMVAEEGSEYKKV